MYSADKELFGKAVLEALTSKYEEELKQCTEGASCSDMHLKKMSNILGYNVCRDKIAGKSLKKMWAAILIAAALLLVGCTAYVYREEIKGFILEMHEKFVRVQFDVDLEAVPKSIQEEYTLGYVPEGFEQIEKKVDFAFNYQKWNNVEGKEIIFYQTLLQGNEGAQFDVERGEMMFFECGEYSIYLKSTDFDKCYLWRDDYYELMLIVPTYVLDEEVIKIIDNIIP